MKTALLALALTAAGLTAPALAQNAEAYSTVVSYNDLDLATAAGRKTLDFRVEKAARDVCRVDESIVGTRILPKDRRLCYREARRQLDRQLAAVLPRGTAG